MGGQKVSTTGTAGMNNGGGAGSSMASKAYTPPSGPELSSELSGALPKEASMIVEVIQLMFRKSVSRHSRGQMVHLGISAGLPNLLLNILKASSDKLDQVVSPDALKVHCVEILKGMLDGADATYKALLESILFGNAIWKEYCDQSHDLYMTERSRTDVLMIHDASFDKFTKMLTAGAASSSSSSSTVPEKANLAATTSIKPTPTPISTKVPAPVVVPPQSTTTTT